MTRTQKMRVYVAAMREIWQIRKERLDNARGAEDVRNAVAEAKAAVTVLQASFVRW